MTARYFKMTEIHQRIDDKLRRELQQRFPDQWRVQKLKRLKLRAKDMLHRLRPKAA